MARVTFRLFVRFSRANYPARRAAGQIGDPMGAGGSQVPVLTSAPGAAGRPAPEPGRRPGRPGRSRVAGFDGLRALAVLAVVAFHEDLRALPGGFLGVDVFFALSGYLITDLLAAQFGRFGRLDLRGFWIRRARRLLPALAALLVTVTATTAVAEPDQLGSLRPALVSAITYTSNWWQALHHQSYFDLFGPPPPLQHLWSLAVEEQFYLIWPLVLAFVLARWERRRLRAALAWAGAAASAVAIAFMYVPGSDPSRVYYGTDTHSTALLVGAALALTWPLTQLAAASPGQVRRFDTAGLIGLAVLAWAVGHFSGSDPAVYPAGLVVAALAAGAVIAAAATAGVVAGMLSWSPLRWLGVRSYGIYLWHWPVIAFYGALAGAGSQTAAARGAQTAIAITIAAASWHWIEEPILRNGLRNFIQASSYWLAGSLATARRSPLGLLPLALPVALTAVACTAGYGILHRPGGPTLQQQIRAGAQISAATRASQAGLATPSPAASSAIAPAVMTGHPQVAPSRRISGSKVTAIGDSVMLASAEQLHGTLPGIYIDAAVSRQMSAGLAAIQSLAESGRLRSIVVVGLGTNGTVTSRQIGQLRAMIGPRRWLVLINTYEARPWQDEVNAQLAAAAQHYPQVLLVNWHDAIRSRTSLLWDDEVHPRPSGAVLYARIVKAAVLTARNDQRTGNPGPGAPASRTSPAIPDGAAPPGVAAGGGGEARAG
jgi:peptidoglycan/LPS O-acetylase OafA/YrhL